jgi:O-antigen/teichoic acid export membrane protein
MGKSSAKLLAGGAVAAALSLASFALTARTLGPHDFGLLLIAVAYTQTVGRLVGFQSWHVVIRFASQFDRASPVGVAAYFSLVRYSFLLDVIGAIAALIAVALSAFVLAYLSPSADLPAPVVMLFSLSLLCRVNGTALGVLRLADRFGALAAQGAVIATLKLFLVVFAYYWDSSLITFAAIWAACMAIEYLAVVVQAFLLLRAEGFKVSGSARLSPDVSQRDYWRLHVSANLWSGAQSLRELDSLVVATALSPAALAIYRTGRDLCIKLNRLLDPLVLVVYPYLARARANNDRPGARHILFATTLATGAAGVVALLGYAIVGRWGIDVLFGAEFASAFQPGLIFMLAFVFVAFGRVAVPAAMASDRAHRGLLVTVLAVPPFLVAAYFLSVHAGVLGAAVAFLAYSALTSVLTVAIVARRERSP